MQGSSRTLLRRLLREVGVALLDVVSDGHCAACGGVGPLEADALCRPCRSGLRSREASSSETVGVPCARCGASKLSESSRCPRADDAGRHEWLRGIAFARSVWSYSGSGGALVRRLKFGHDRAALRLLARAMALVLVGWARRDGRRALFVSVPLHRSRRRARGLDQAAMLGAEVARRLGRPFLSGVLVRVRPTLPQGDPRVTSRERNVEGAFELRRSLSARAIRGRHVVLVDDVTTSGATARACARVLREGGARSVVLLTACRARG